MHHEPVEQVSGRHKRPAFTSRLFLIGLFLALVSTSIASQSSQKSGDAAPPSFAYNRSAPLDLKEESAREQDNVLIRDVNYAPYAPGSGRGRIKAYIVRPSGKGPFAGVLFFHWLGEPNGDRNEFLNEAVALAKQGTVSVLIQGYFPWAVEPADAPTDRKRVVEETIEVRRALDLLLSQPQVDRKRIGYVGHDYGAMYGAIVAGVEKRVKTYVFIAGMGSFSDWSLKYWTEPIKKGAGTYMSGMDPVDPIHHVSRAAPAALLFQFSSNDKYIPKPTAKAFYDDASKPKQILWYETDHALNIEAARKDRRDWLARRLRLAK